MPEGAVRLRALEEVYSKVKEPSGRQIAALICSAISGEIFSIPFPYTTSLKVAEQDTDGITPPIPAYSRRLCQGQMCRLQFIQIFDHFLHADDNQREPIVIELVGRVAG
jgi:hypothetical protein